MSTCSTSQRKNDAPRPSAPAAEWLPKRGPEPLGGPSTTQLRRSVAKIICKIQIYHPRLQDMFDLPGGYIPLTSTLPIGNILKYQHYYVSSIKSPSLGPRRCVLTTSAGKIAGRLTLKNVPFVEIPFN